MPLADTLPANSAFFINAISNPWYARKYLCLVLVEFSRGGHKEWHSAWLLKAAGTPTCARGYRNLAYPEVCPEPTWATPAGVLSAHQ
jgi:hypothetical protein